MMMPADLTDTDRATLAALLRDTIAADRFPLSPRVRRWKAIPLPPLARLHCHLASCRRCIGCRDPHSTKLEPPAAKREPLPPLKPPGEPSMVVAWWRG